MNRKEPIVDDQYYHVYNRGNRKQPIFGGDSDYRSFLKKFYDGSWKYKVRVIVCALMPNHFHFVLVQTVGGSIEGLMTSVETSAAKRFNTKYGKVGHLFQGRYRYNRIVSETGLLVVARYIHLNPVEAGLVRSPEKWPYSDFAEYVSMADGLEGLSESRLNRGDECPLPCTPREYVDMVRDSAGKGVLPPLPFLDGTPLA
jgi:putative transposase